MSALIGQLENWRRWLEQGNHYGTGYPSESSTEHIAMPFKRRPTTEEALEEHERTIPADERAGERIEQWVRQLREPMRTAIRVQYVVMPEHDRHAMGLTWDAWQERRARITRRIIRNQAGIEMHIRLDDYERAVSRAMETLDDMRLLWAA